MCMLDVRKNLFVLGSNKSPVYRSKYEKTNHLVDKMSEIIHFAAIKLGVAVVVLPKAIISYFMYFTTDAGTEAIELPLPA